MREARVAGCRASSTVPAHHSGKQQDTDALPCGAPGKPGDLRVVWPKASAREFHQRIQRESKTLGGACRPPRAVPILRSQLRRLGFGRLARRDPGKAMRTYHEGWGIDLKTGTFYLAENRKFLLCSDRCRSSSP